MEKLSQCSKDIAVATELQRETQSSYYVVCIGDHVQIKECDAKRYGSCDGQIKIHSRLHCDCLLIEEHHNFCADIIMKQPSSYFPIHPCLKLLKIHEHDSVCIHCTIKICILAKN